MDLSFLPWLCCPFCGGSFQASGVDRTGDKLGYGVLTCYCGRYPVVAGIPVLKKDTSGRQQRRQIDRVIALIEAGRHEEALLALMPSPGPDAPTSERWLPLARPLSLLKRLVGRPNAPGSRSWSEQAVAMLMNRKGQVAACDLLDFFLTNQKENYNYSFYRFGQPRHLVALSFASIIDRPNKPILDLACGCGHITRSLVQRANEQQVIGLDKSFFGLYIAKQWVAPQAQFVCCDVDTSLPFSDGAFAAALCSDAFHYFMSKHICVRELERVTQDDGFFMLVWVHSANVRLPHDGLPLPPEGYRALVTHMPYRLVADSTVLARYLRKQGPLLRHLVDLKNLVHEPLLSLVASHRKEVFEDYGSFQNWPHAEGNLGLNPLYVEHKRDRSGYVYLRRTFPSAFYEQDHAQCKEYLPETVTVSSDVLEDLANGRRTPEIQRLIEQFVLLGIPERYI